MFNNIERIVAIMCKQTQPNNYYRGVIEIDLPNGKVLLFNNTDKSVTISPNLVLTNNRLDKSNYGIVDKDFKTHCKTIKVKKSDSRRFFVDIDLNDELKNVYFSYKFPCDKETYNKILNCRKYDLKWSDGYVFTNDYSLKHYIEYKYKNRELKTWNINIDSESEFEYVCLLLEPVGYYNSPISRKYTNKTKSVKTIILAVSCSDEKGVDTIQDLEKYVLQYRNTVKDAHFKNGVAACVIGDYVFQYDTKKGWVDNSLKNNILIDNGDSVLHFDPLELTCFVHKKIVNSTSIIKEPKIEKAVRGSHIDPNVEFFSNKLQELQNDKSISEIEIDVSFKVKKINDIQGIALNYEIQEVE